MTLQRRVWIGLGSLVLAGATVLVGVRALAQGQPGGPPPPGGFGGPGGFRPGGGFMMGGGGSIAATTNRVYVLRGNTLYAIDAATLKVLGSTELPPPQMGPRPGAPGAGAPPPGQ